MADEDSNIDFAGQQKTRDDKVRSLLTKGDKFGALAASLENPPLGCKDADVKKRAAETVSNVLTSVKDNEVAALVAKLDSVQLDALMKYIYKCFESLEQAANPLQNSNSLFKWHKEVLDKAGMSSIIRVLTERKTL